MGTELERWAVQVVKPSTNGFSGECLVGPFYTKEEGSQAAKCFEYSGYKDCFVLPMVDPSQVEKHYVIPFPERQEEHAEGTDEKDVHDSLESIPAKNAEEATQASYNQPANNL